MAFEYGFYNSINGDRTYDAGDFGKLFDGIIRDGVFESIGSKLFTTIGENVMEIVVGTGKAWFNHTWSLNTTPMVFTISPSHPVLARYDTVVLEINEMADVYGRVNEIKVIEGTPSSNPKNPELVNNDYIHQYPLAYIKINPTVTTLTAADIEIIVGQEPCPFVTGILETADITELFANWQSQFNTWFANLKEQLTGDIVTNLQNQIDNCLKVTDIATQADVDAGTAGKVITAPFFKKSINEAEYKVGDTLTTWRTDLGENWLLCNGDMLDPAEYPELNSTNPGYVSNFYSDLYRSVRIPDLNGNQRAQYTIFKDKVIGVHIDGQPRIYVVDPVSGEHTVFTLSVLNQVYSEPNTGMAVVVDGVLYISRLKTTANSSRVYLCLIKCVGDPMIEENWSVYMSQNAFSATASDYISGVSIGENNVVYMVLRYPQYIYKFIIEDLTKDISFVSRTQITYPEYQDLSKSYAFSYRNSLYVFTQSSDNTRDVILKFRLSSDGWEYDEIHSLSHDVMGYSLRPNPYTRISSPQSSMVLALSTTNSAYSRLIQINPDDTVYESDYIPGLSVSSLTPAIVEKNGKYVIKNGSHSNAACIDSLTNQAIANAETITITNGVTIALGGIDDSDIFCLIPVISEHATDGNYAYYIPLLCAPKISQSTTYTYIKAKEDAPNANQQTDTPAS